jgi:uncharacterized protein (TIGR03435 family)
MNFQPEALAWLEASLVRPLILVAAGWLILRILRVRHPASRHAVWTAVLAGMLLLPIVTVVTPHWTLPVLPSKEATAQSQRPITSAEVSENPGAVPSSPIVLGNEGRREAALSFAWPSLPTLIVWGYLAGLVVMLMYRLLGWALLRGVVSRSRSLRPSCLRESADVVTPVAVGVLRPSVILPAGWRAWNAQTRRAVLAHEFAHLRRRDTLVAALARLVKCVFWFHPAAWWVSRQTSDLAELACDAVALQRVGDPAGYSRLLVAFAGAVNRSGRRVALPGLAMASGSRMSDRVDQVFEMSGGTMRKLARPGVWLATIGLPAFLLAATVVPTSADPQQSAAPQVADAPTAMKITFEVVSIKPCTGEAGGTRGSGVPRGSISPGYVIWTCESLAELAEAAWGGFFGHNDLVNTPQVPPGSRPDLPKRLRGGPAWVEDERFQIEIKVSGDTTDLTGPARVNAVREAMRPALRTMLADRFQLKVRKATEERPMYAMTVAKDGLKITRTASEKCWQRPANLGRGEQGTPPPGFEGTPACGVLIQGRMNRGNHVFDVSHTTLKDFATWLSRNMDRYVLDKTGVEGRFSFALTYAPDDSTPGNIQERARSTEAFAALRAQAGLPPAPPREPVQPDGPTIFKALEALGLKLEPTKGPGEYILIEIAQRPKPDSIR